MRYAIWLITLLIGAVFILAGLVSTGLAIYAALQRTEALSQAFFWQQGIMYAAIATALFVAGFGFVGLANGMSDIGEEG